MISRLIGKKGVCSFFRMNNPICGLVLKELLEDEGFQKLIDERKIPPS